MLCDFPMCEKSPQLDVHLDKMYRMCDEHAILMSLLIVEGNKLNAGKGKVIEIFTRKVVA